MDRQRSNLTGVPLALLAGLALALVAPQAHAACGDGLVQAGEQCDDGNTRDTDGCTASCETQSGYTCGGAPSVCATSGLNVYHIGHSLVNDMMPEMLRDLAVDAGFGHSYDKHRVSSPFSPTLRFKWNNPTIEGDGDSLSFVELPTGNYDVLVLTEGLPLDVVGDETALYAGNYYDMALSSNPTAQVYLYETWYRNQQPDLAAFRENTLAWRAQWQQVIEQVNAERAGPDMHLVPGGAALVALLDAIDSEPDFPQIDSLLDLFRLTPQGEVDRIHLSELGRYFIALVHFATLYRESPVGLTFQTTDRDGDPFEAPSPELALRMQQIAWEVVSSEPLTGVGTGPDGDGDGVADAVDNCPADPNASQTDRDADLLGDACDLCPDFASSNQDTDANGIGDECECGDQTGDGRVDVADILAINAVILGQAPAGPLCDANDDGLCNIADILGANAKIFGAPAFCARHPAP